MGGNGSFNLKTIDTEAGRRWKTVYVTKSGIKIIEMKNPKASFKLPEESHSPNSIYAIFNKGGKGLKGIAKYDSDGKKIFEIHTTDHNGLGAHFHPWKDGHPLDAKPLTKSMKKLIDDVLNFK